ncbi:MAG: c-type cytochrome [Thermoflexus sp.]|uniref:c-type cytochrome n=1 Tax=Thermoflexus sp. TaxID=1969742 RepID=UPI0025D8C956|nr:c-type cytochrome [Thermoflexus sp.]MCS6962869.1 c-type cytochrome [Thermoflexus sp.]MCS7350575.1 c-type cytochrome [Thermoflexus sp.]MDW8180026.1 c-type cytochrome [Anaerolineae bacterium]MDW8185129.1 c-type cytochrome [Anaerolineae bacterium]
MGSLSIRQWGMVLGMLGLVFLFSAASTHAYQEEEAERGAAVFARRCSTCHGDQGQGLTDEWRATWPPTHQNCWKANCHGPQPYPEDGFTLPRVVPALIGPNTLQRFTTAADLYAYIRAQMPFHAPGSLPEEDYRAVTAFLLQRHGIPADGQLFDPEAARGVLLRPLASRGKGALGRIMEDFIRQRFPWWILGGIGVAGLLWGMMGRLHRRS